MTTNSHKVDIVGGGLAGMVAALRLLERGCEVTLYESSDRMGGKAGASHNGVDWDEHGYHIFPMWYENIWKLVDELGIKDNFADVVDFKQLRLGSYPGFQTLTNLGSVRYVFRNLFSGVLPALEMVLFFYSTLDLISQSFNSRAFLDQTSVNGFIRDRFYRMERVAIQHQDLLLKGISVPSYDVSAMTMRNVLKFWLRSPIPMHRVLKGNLQEFWIYPIQKRIEELGGQIHFQHRLVGIDAANHRVTELRFVTPDGEYIHKEIDRLIVAIPWEKLAAILDDRMFEQAPTLFNIRYLSSVSMAALNVYLKRRIPGIPKDHVNLLGSKYGLSFIDVGQWWSQYDTTVLNLIASDFTPLVGRSQEVAVQAMIEDLIEFIPAIRLEDIDHVNFQPHANEPLFMNEVGAWHYRPGAKTELDNLYLAGDYCRSHIDLVSMEGAVSTGLLAADAVRKDFGLEQSIDCLQPKEYPRLPLFVVWVLLLPFIAVIKVLAFILYGDDPQLEQLKDRAMRRVTERQLRAK
jgi:predicted NAD/FAD-dependent oxidoreductase